MAQDRPKRRGALTPNGRNSPSALKGYGSSYGQAVTEALFFGSITDDATPPPAGQATATLITPVQPGVGLGTTAYVVTHTVPVGARLLLVLKGYSDGANGEIAGSNLVVNTDQGLTWQNAVETGTDNSPAWSYATRMLVSSPTTAASLQLTFSAGIFDIVVWEPILYSLSGEAASPIGAVGIGTNFGDGSASLNLSAPPAASSVVIGANFTRLDGASGGAVPASGWTEDYEHSVGFTVTSQTQQRTGSTSPLVEWDDVQTGGNAFGGHMVAVEILAGAAGGGNFTVGTNDTRSSSDSATATKAASATASDARVLADSAAAIKTASSAAIDTRVVTDSSLSTKTASSAASDTRGAADLAVASKATAAAATDTRTLSDSATSLRGAASSASDTRSVGDSAAAARLAASLAADSRAPSDAASAFKTSNRAATDTRAISDAAAALRAAAAAALDVRALSDSSVALKSSARSAIDSRVTSDSAVAAKSATTVASDTRVASDVAIASRSSASVAFDTRALSDSSTSVRGAAVSAADTRAASDIAAALKTAAAAASDARTSSDASTASKTVAMAATDTRTTSDSATAIRGAAVTATDTRPSSDSASAVKTASAASQDVRPTGDQATAAKTASAASEDLVTRADSATGVVGFPYFATAQDAAARSDSAVAVLAPAQPPDALPLPAALLGRAPRQNKPKRPNIKFRGLERKKDEDDTEEDEKALKRPEAEPAVDPLVVVVPVDLPLELPPGAPIAEVGLGAGAAPELALLPAAPINLEEAIRLDPVVAFESAPEVSPVALAPASSVELAPAPVPAPADPGPNPLVLMASQVAQARADAQVMELALRLFVRQRRINSLTKLADDVADGLAGVAALTAVDDVRPQALRNALRAVALRVGRPSAIPPEVQTDENVARAAAILAAIEASE